MALTLTSHPVSANCPVPHSPTCPATHTFKPLTAFPTLHTCSHPLSHPAAHTLRPVPATLSPMHALSLAHTPLHTHVQASDQETSQKARQAPVLSSLGLWPQRRNAVRSSGGLAEATVGMRPLAYLSSLVPQDPMGRRPARKLGQPKSKSLLPPSGALKEGRGKRRGEPPLCSQRPVSQ